MGGIGEKQWRQQAAATAAASGLDQRGLGNLGVGGGGVVTILGWGGCCYTQVLGKEGREERERPDTQGSKAMPSLRGMFGEQCTTYNMSLSDISTALTKQAVVF